MGAWGYWYDQPNKKKMQIGCFLWLHSLLSQTKHMTFRVQTTTHTHRWTMTAKFELLDLVNRIPTTIRCEQHVWKNYFYVHWALARAFFSFLNRWAVLTNVRILLDSNLFGHQLLYPCAAPSTNWTMTIPRNVREKLCHELFWKVTVLRNVRENYAINFFL